MNPFLSAVAGLSRRITGLCTDIQSSLPKPGARIGTFRNRGGWLLGIRTLGACCILVVGAIAAASMSSFASAATPIRAMKCKDVWFDVSLTQGERENQRVAGWLCYKPPLKGKTIHVLLSGATYDHKYWDFPIQSPDYSYVKALTNAGHAVLNIDRIGTGLSSRPPGDQVTITSNAFVVHQIVQALRGGIVNKTASSKILLVGHSLGSAIALVEAATYDDVDGLILSGLLHTFGPGSSSASTAFYPAENDPQYRDEDLPPGYLTTLPGVRASLFYWSPGSDQEVVQQDEATKQTVSVGELGELANVLSADFSSRIDIPVLNVVGQYDALFCTPPLCPESQAEQLLYGAAKDYELRILENSGHLLNLHTNASAWFALVQEWAERHFGARTK